MLERVENRMVVDSEWNEIEYGVPNKRRLLRERHNYDLEELEENEYEII